MTKSLNIFPYYDDFAPEKNFHKILFVPGNPVQARELTQIQSIIQEQIKRHGDHIFKNGTVVIPGQLYFDDKVRYLKVDTIYGGANVESYAAFLKGKTVTGLTSGVSAIIVHIEPSTATDPTTIYFKYTAANATVSAFSNNEVIKESTGGLEIKIQAVSDFTGSSSICSIEEGVYYINGYFVGVNKQTVAVSKYTNLSSNVVGLSFNESIVSASDDESLYDNSNGFANFGAPGADRLKIDLVLTSKPYDYVDDDGDTDLDFIELIKIKDGKLQYMVEDTEYSQINKMLARRTFEESGNYVVTPFNFKFRNYRSNNRGQWVASTAYLAGDIVSNSGNYYYCRIDGYSGSTAPTHTYGTQSDSSIQWTQTTSPQFNNGLIIDGNDVSLDDQRVNDLKYAITTSPGKAYINGYEVNLREAKQIIGNKARDARQVSNTSLFAPIGQYVLVDNLVGVFDTKAAPQLSIKDSGGNVVGTAYARSVEYVSGTIGTSAARYRLFLFGVVMNSGKSFALNAVSFSFSSTFSCSTVLSTTQLTGLVSTSASSSTVSGKGTLFQSELAVGQLIKVGSETKLISAIASNVSLTVSTSSGNSAFSNTNTDVAGFEVNSDMQSFGPIIKPLDNKFVKSIRDSFNQIDTEYVITRTINITVSGGNTGSSSALTATGETFASTNAADYVTVNSSGTVYAPTYSLNGSSTVLTISAGSLPNGNYTVLAKIRKQGQAALEKTKTLQTKTITVNSGNIKDELDTTIITSNYNFSNSTISLTEADIVRVIKITMSGGNPGQAYNATGEVDVTTWYTLDDGQRADFYDLGAIKLKSGQNAPTKPIKVTFEYFDHSSGDYFSVDSYKNLPYSLIPSVVLNGVTYPLRDCLDFRSRKSDDGSGFSASGSSVSEPFNTSTSISTSYSHYLPRVDVVTLSQNGEFSVYSGAPAINPTEPSISSQNMKLVVVNVAAYTAVPEKLTYKEISHRRYTMADIGKIDNRLQNVEYYVSLNELEKKTVNMQITDSNGLNRYKNGFFADNFSSYITSDIGNPDYAATINPEYNTAGPKTVTHNIALYEISGTTDSSRRASGYQVTGAMMSLPYSEVTLIDQPAASRSEYINPYAVVSFTNTGIATLFPESDIWTDTRTDYNESWVAGSQIVTSSTNTSSSSTDYNYWYYGYYGYYGYYYGYWYGYGYGGSTSNTSVTTTTQVVGYQTSTVSKSEDKSSHDLSYMRSRSVGISLQGMKPYTTFHGFMNDQNIDGIIIPAKTLRYSSESGSFKGWLDTAKTTESLSGRVTTINSYDSYDYGDVITFSSGATAVVAAKVSQIVNGVEETVLKLVNVKGSVSAGNSFRGSLSGATAVVSSLSNETSLTTNSVGEFFGTINFNSSYTTGEKNLKFNDTTDGNTANATTEVKANFNSHGTLNITSINETKKTDTLVSQNTNTHTTYTQNYNYWYWYGYYYYGWC